MKKKPVKERYRVKQLKSVDRPPYLGSSSARASSPSINEPLNPPVSHSLQEDEQANKTENLVSVIPSESPPIIAQQTYASITVSSSTIPVSVATQSINPPVDEEGIEVKRKKETEQQQELVNLNKLPFEKLDFGVSKIQPTVKVHYAYNPQKEFVLNGRVYEKDKDIHFYDILHFVPNYGILLYKEDLDKKLGELVKLLNEYPDKKVKIYGHGGLEYEEGSTEFDIHFQEVEVAQNIYEFERIHYGSHHEVYEQTIYDLGNEDPYHIQRIEEENRAKIEQAKVGYLLSARAQRIKEYLILKGISKKRISALRGSYLPHPNHLVEIKITD